MNIFTSVLRYQGKQAVKKSRAQHSLIRKASERSHMDDSSAAAKRSLRMGKNYSLLNELIR